MNINKNILKILQNSKNVLDTDAWNHIRSFVKKEMYKKAVFTDRAGEIDPYYTVFGYTLCFIFDIKVDTKLANKLLEDWEHKNKLDFVHTISLLRCRFLIQAFKIKQKAGAFAKIALGSSTLQEIAQKDLAKKILKKEKHLFKVIEEYESKDSGYNHFNKRAVGATIYANFLIMGLFQDLFLKDFKKGLRESTCKLKLKDGAFVNQSESKQGVSAATAAALLIINEFEGRDKSIKWLKSLISKDGGFLAAPEAPIADVLSTGTSVLSLKLIDKLSKEKAIAAAEFVNLHWHQSGGFFGSIADQHPDVEYTFYALLAIGALG